MKIKYLLIIALVVVLGSCSSAYRTGQTPDDVYYSPVPAQETYVVTKSSDRNSYNYQNAEEREIRRAIRNPRYRAIISYNAGYGYDPYMYNPYAYNSFGFSPFGYNHFGYNPYYFNSYGYKGFYDPFGYNPYYGYSGYSPYYGGYNPSYGYIPVVVGKSSNNTGARKYNLGSYNSPSSSARTFTPNTKSSVTNRSAAPVRSFDRTSSSTPQTREKTGVGNVIRRVFTPSDNRQYTPPANNNNRSNTRPVRSSPPVRTFDPPARNNNQPSRSFDPPTRSTTPPASNNTRSSTPVRTFRNN